MLKIFQGFKTFILKGNAVDLAVGVVIGASFGAVVNALVRDLLTPLIGAVVSVPNFSNLVFTINRSRFMYGDFINHVISFILIAAAVYFLVILPMNALTSRLPKKGTVSTTKICPECKSEIPLEARRCAHCTQVV